MSSILPSPPPLATPSVPGLASIGAQTFAGLKSFQNGVSVNTIADPSTVTRLDLSTTTNKATSSVVDGASALGYLFDTTNSLSNATAQILSVRNFGTEALGLYPNASTGAHPLLKFPDSAEIQIGTAKVHASSGLWVFTVGASFGAGMSVGASGITFNDSTVQTSAGAYSLGTYGTSPNNNGASLIAGALTLQPADATHAGGITANTFTSFPLYVKDFGAFGDCTTGSNGHDDTAAVQAALDAALAQNRPLYFQAGKGYRITKELSVGEIRLHGHDATLHCNARMRSLLVVVGFLEVHHLNIWGWGLADKSARVIGGIRAFNTSFYEGRVDGCYLAAGLSGFLDLSTVTTHVNTIVCSSSEGVSTNWSVKFIGDSGAGVTLNEVFATSTIVHFHPGVSTVGDVEAAIRASSINLKIQLNGTSSNVLTSPADAFGPTSMTGGTAANNDNSTFQYCDFQIAGTYFHSSGWALPDVAAPKVLIAGTVATTFNSNIITGTGTHWLKDLQDWRPGDIIAVGSTSTQWFQILSVDTDTQITTQHYFAANLTRNTQEYAVGVGDGYHETPFNDNNLTKFFTTLARNNAGCGMAFNGLYGSTAEGMQSDYNGMYNFSVGQSSIGAPSESIWHGIYTEGENTDAAVLVAHANGIEIHGINSAVYPVTLPNPSIANGWWSGWIGDQGVTMRPIGGFASYVPQMLVEDGAISRGTIYGQDYFQGSHDTDSPLVRNRGFSSITMRDILTDHAWAAVSGTQDGATSIAYKFDTAYSMVTAGAKLLSMQNLGTEKFYVTNLGEVVSLATALGGAASGHANFMVPNNPASSSPALANFNNALEIGGKYTNAASTTSADVYIGAMQQRTAGPVVTLLNNYGQGGSEFHVADFMYNGDAKIGGALYLSQGGANSRVIADQSQMYLQSIDTFIIWQNGSNSNDLAQFYTQPGGSLVGSIGTGGKFVSKSYFESQATGSGATGIYLSGATNSGYIQTATTTMRMLSGVADGASALAYKLDTTNSLTTNGAALLSVQNATVEKFSIDKSGNLLIQGVVNGPAATSGAVTFPNGVDITAGKALYLNGVTQTIGVFDNSGHIDFFGASAYHFDNKLVSDVVLGAGTAVAWKLDSSAGAAGNDKLFSLLNNGAEEMYVDRLGNMVAASYTPGAGSTGFMASVGGHVAIFDGATRIATFATGGGIAAILPATYAFYANDPAGGFQSAGSTRLTTELIDGSTAVGGYSDTVFAYSTAGAKLWSFRNHTNEKAFVDKDGLGNFAGGLTVPNSINVNIGGATVSDNGTSTSFSHRGVNAEYWQAPLFYGTGSGITVEAATSFKTSADGADGAGAVAAISDTSVTYSTTGARLHSWRNNTVEKASIDKDGVGTFASLVVGANGIIGPVGVSNALPLPSGANINAGKALYLNGATQTIGIFDSSGAMDFFGASSYVFDAAATVSGSAVATAANGQAGGHIEAIAAGNSYTVNTGPHIINASRCMHPIVAGVNARITLVFITAGGGGTFSVKLRNTTTSTDLVAHTSITATQVQDSVQGFATTIAGGASIGDDIQLQIDFTGTSVSNPVVQVRVEW